MKMETYKLYPNVKLGKNCQIGDFVIIGLPPRGKKDGELETVIGDGAVIRSHTVIYAGNKIGENFQTGHHVNIREENEIGDDVSIGTKSVVEHHVKISGKVRIHTQVFVPEFTVLEEGCWVGPNVVITNTPHPLCDKAKNCLKNYGSVKVKKNAKIGANSTILPAIVLGENSLVGAGSVVTKNVPENKVAVGNPAKVIKDVSALKCPPNLKEKPY